MPPIIGSTANPRCPPLRPIIRGQMIPRNGPAKPSNAEKNTHGELNADPALIRRIRSQMDSDELDLSLSSLETVPFKSIQQNYGEVTSLDLSYNFLQILPEQFMTRLLHLVKLKLRGNQMKLLPDEFGALYRLEYLDISVNKLETLPLSMGRLRNLRYINISGNPLRQPLARFPPIGDTRGQMGGTPMIIQFLANLAQRITHICGNGDSSYPSPRTPRKITFAMDKDPHCTETNLNQNYEELEEDIFNELTEQIRKRNPGTESVVKNGPKVLSQLANINKINQEIKQDVIMHNDRTQSDITIFGIRLWNLNWDAVPFKAFLLLSTCLVALIFVIVKISSFMYAPSKTSTE